jgi:hypothetical protein
MVDLTLEDGKETTCMGKVIISGKMGENIRESTQKTKNMDMEYIHGQTVESTKATGKMVNSMGRESTYCQTDR